MECATCECVWLGAGGVGGEWVTGLGLGFTNSGGTWRDCDMCLCFGCGGEGGVGGEWVGVVLGESGWGWCWGRVAGRFGPGSGRVWCYVCVWCESGFSV